MGETTRSTVGVTTAGGIAVGETEVDVTPVDVTTAVVTIVGVKAEENTVGKRIPCTVASRLATSTVLQQAAMHRPRRETTAYHPHYLLLALPMLVWTIGHQMLFPTLLERQEAVMLEMRHPNGPDHILSITSTSSPAPLPLQMHGACLGLSGGTVMLAMVLGTP